MHGGQSPRITAGSKSRPRLAKDIVRHRTLMSGSSSFFTLVSLRQKV